MFEDLDDPQAPSPTRELRDTVVRVAAHRRMRRRLVVAAVAAFVVAVPVALVATGTSPIRRFSVSSASDHKTTSTTTAAQAAAKPKPGARGTSTPTTWNGVLHCDSRSLAERQQAGDKTIAATQRFGRWIVTTRSVSGAAGTQDHQALSVQDCSTGKTRAVAAPPPGALCTGYDAVDMGADVLLYRCSYSNGTHEVVANDLTRNTVTIVTEAPDRPWSSGSMAPGGGFVVFTGAAPATDSGGATDVFVFDLATKTLDRLPRDFGGATDRDSVSAGISIDGRSVLLSTATSSAPANLKLFLFDRQTRQFEAVPAPDRVVGDAVLSGDGHHVGFVAQPGPDQNDAVYVFDSGSPAVAFVSPCAPDGVAADCRVHITENGASVTFTASLCVTVTGTTDRSGGTYTFDRTTGTIRKDGPAGTSASCGGG